MNKSFHIHKKTYTHIYFSNLDYLVLLLLLLTFSILVYLPFFQVVNLQETINNYFFLVFFVFLVFNLLIYQLYKHYIHLVFYFHIHHIHQLFQLVLSSHVLFGYENLMLMNMCIFYHNHNKIFQILMECLIYNFDCGIITFMVLMLFIAQHIKGHRNVAM